MNRPINEHDEFLLSRLLDNDLSPEESATLQTRIEREPELRRAYASMTRIDALLVARRADQPQVNWSRFHSDVMSRVEAEAARSITFRFANYLRAALPLAAAAAIALVIWYWPHGGAGLPTPDHQKPNPQLARADESVVRFSQPDQTGADDTIRVSFARSDEISKEYRAEDEKSRNQKGWGGIKTTRAHPSSPGLLAEALPLLD
jgi:hypothetical protein